MEFTACTVVQAVVQAMGLFNGRVIFELMTERTLASFFVCKAYRYFVDDIVNDVTSRSHTEYLIPTDNNVVLD